MVKKKKTPSKWLARLFVTLISTGLLVALYYLLRAFLPDAFVYTAFGPTLLGRNFSVLAIIYNTLFAAALVFAAYFSFQLYKEKHLVVSRKNRSAKRSGVVVGGEAERYKRQRAIYQVGSIIVVALLVGLVGSMTSDPSDAASKISLQDVSYKKIANTPSGLKKANGKVIDTMQGGTTDGKYIYFAFENPKGGGYIAKYTLNGKLVKTSKLYTPKQVGHANAMTYDPVRNRLILAVYRPDGKKVMNRGKVTHFNPDTLNITISRSVNPEASVTNICYNAATNQYVSNGKLYDASLKLVKENLYRYGKYVKQYGDKNSTGQGIECDANNIYVIRYYPHKTKPHTHVYAFDWSGKLTAVYNVKGLKDEAENIFILNNQLYMGVNNGSTYKGNKKDNKNDYFIRLDGITASKDQTGGQLPIDEAIESGSDNAETVHNAITDEEIDPTD